MTSQQINDLLGIKESYKASDALMKILFNKEKREKLFKNFLEIDWHLDQDVFLVYFEEELANKKKYAQDFTPLSVTTLVSQLIGPAEKSRMSMDVAAGTGSLTIQKWYQDRNNLSPWEYLPSNFFYHLEELSDRAIPFLLFNMAIRGMNCVVMHGDALDREFKQVYFLQNDADDFMGFSSINVMPHSKNVEKVLDVRKWLENPIQHIESPNFFETEIGQTSLF